MTTTAQLTPSAWGRTPSSSSQRNIRVLFILCIGICIANQYGKIVKLVKIYPGNNDDINTSSKEKSESSFSFSSSSPPGHLFSPVQLSPTNKKCSKEDRRKVIDMTLINNELSTLELRLNELWNVVDTFYISESVVPFKPGASNKPLHLANAWDDFAKFHSKMVLYEIPEHVSRDVSGAAASKIGRAHV